jgi:hypothetical protein
MAVAAATLVGLLLLFAVLAHFVPGQVTRKNVEAALGRAVNSTFAPTCTGGMGALHCTVFDDSGTSVLYAVHASGSCWQATREGNATGETGFPPASHGCVRLWDDIFSTGVLPLSPAP